MKKNIRFGFGKNWLDFIQKNFEGEKVQIAKGHILSFMEKENLNGLTFLDIGCGSGIHSIAALDAGAASVHGFDYDQNSSQQSNSIEAIGAEWDVAEWDVAEWSSENQTQNKLIYSSGQGVDVSMRIEANLKGQQLNWYRTDYSVNVNNIL